MFLKLLTFLLSSSSRFFASALCASNFFAVATSVSSSLCNATISEPRVFISDSFCCFSCSSLKRSLQCHRHMLHTTANHCVHEAVTENTPDLLHNKSVLPHLSSNQTSSGHLQFMALNFKSCWLKLGWHLLRATYPPNLKSLSPPTTKIQKTIQNVKNGVIWGT